MRLIIDNPMNADLKPFIRDVIIPSTIQILYSILNKKCLIAFDAYLSKRYNKSVHTEQIILHALNNLIIQKYADNFQISINPNIFISGINAKLYDICALINFGNLEVAPYPIFDKTFQKLAPFVPTLYRQYTFGE